MQMRLASRVLVAAVLVVGFALPARAQITSCTVANQNLYVRDVLSDIYLWYPHLPPVSPVQFPTPEAYLEAVRFRQLDASFSYITSRAASDAFYSDSQFIGYGFSMQVAGTAVRVSQVYEDSPAAEAGLDRGASIVEVNGRSVASLIATGAIGGAFGPSTEGVVTTIAFDTRGGGRRHATMVKRAVTIPTVSLARVFSVEGRKVGYVFFRNFVEPSYAALDEAFAMLKDEGVTELVLDLRYNGGGLVNVAVHLGSLIGGAVTRDQVFAEYRHNDKNIRRDQTLRFAEAAQALTLSRAIVIATPSSASASELVINALRPFLPVTVVGDRTYGKPVGQYVVPFCDKVLAPVSFSMVNADGEGGFFGGIPADCHAPDDIEHDLGDANEGSLAEALRFIRTGTCTPPPTDASATQAAGAPRATGWQALINAQ
ncbi:MAG: S41 family peptidase [Vicinamibacterales bacterium]|nr:S41 family peptidase [Vicinamibacterales bacterium]